MDFPRLGQFLLRRARLKSYRTERQALERLSEADLADIGLRRYQLGHVARINALK